MFNLGLDRFRWSAISILAAAVLGVFILQSIETTFLHTNFLANYGALSIDGLRHGSVWQLVTYVFLHGSFWQVAMNILCLLLIGLPLQADIGQRAMTLVLVLMTLGGGLAFSLVHVNTGGILMGTSALSIGLLTLFCLSYPDRPIYAPVIFVLPITCCRAGFYIFTVGSISLALSLASCPPWPTPRATPRIWAR